MAKRKSATAGLRVISDELDSFLEAFDPADAEDAQVRTAALISAMIAAGVLKESRSVKNFRLDMALARVQLAIPNREDIVARAEMFHDLINSYDGEPDEDDMESARTLLEEIAKALNSAIIKKGQTRLDLEEKRGAGMK
jgi:predicted nuclease with TOPRIM domain